MGIARKNYEKTAVGSVGGATVSSIRFELDAFQTVVAEFDDLENAGMIEFVEKHHETQSGHRYVDAVKFKRLI